MKKTLAVLLATILCMSSLTGCGSTNPSSTPDSSDAPSNSQAAAPSYDETKTADLVIVGAGGAGLSAALEAVQNGAEKVIILEATGKTGGSLNFTSGTMSAAGTTIQKEDSITDSAEEFKKDIIRIGSDMGGKINTELVDAFVNENTATFEWLWENGLSEYSFSTDKDGKRAVFAPEHVLYSIPRSYKAQPKDPATYKAPAHELLDGMVKKESKIEIDFFTKATDLIANEKGQVLSVVGTNSNNGTSTRYDSKNGIVVATGGYSANSALMGKFAEHGSDYLIGGPASADGNGLLMMQKVGAALTDDEVMGYIPTFPMGLENKDDPTTGRIASTYTWKAGGIVVNKEGKRFVNECEPNNSLREVALEKQPDALQYDIFTDKILEDLNAANAAGMWNFIFAKEGAPGNHTIVEASSIEELASKLNMDAATLKTTVDEYNAAVEQGGTDTFGRTYDDSRDAFKVAVNKIEGDKYYAVPLRALVVMTLGGVQANGDMQVLDAAGTPIPGLYAAGEVVGGTWGKFVSGGTGVMGPITFGRIAARKAMTTTPAEGYTVKPAANLLDEKLFEKKNASSVDFDMTKTLKDGEYETTVDGQNGPMNVAVTISGGKISAVTIKSHNETEGIAAGALEQIPAKIVEGNSVSVDAVSGATLTSERIKKAVVDCLTQAAE